MEDCTYIIVEWPESQAFMDCDWFDEEASLADCEKFGSSAYFIPIKRFREFFDNGPETDSAGFTETDR